MSFVATHAQAVPTSANAERAGACEVCELLDSDQRAKRVSWCSLCGAWLCEACRRNPLRRARAAWRKAMGA